MMSTQCRKTVGNIYPVVVFQLYLAYLRVTAGRTRGRKCILGSTKKGRSAIEYQIPLSLSRAHSRQRDGLNL